MDDVEDFTQLDDPAFLAERRRVRALVERTPTDLVPLCVHSLQEVAATREGSDRDVRLDAPASLIAPG